MAKLLAVLLISVGLLPARAEDFGVRLVFGDNDSVPTVWDGTLAVRNGARVTSLDGWRFEDGDQIVSNTSWKCSTRRIRRRGAAGQGPNVPIVGNGVVAQLAGATAATELEVKTVEGSFTVRPGDIPYGKTATALGGRVLIDRVPSTTRLTSSTEQQDYPAAASTAGGDIWIAWIEFEHNPEHNRLRANFQEPPEDFKEWTSPPGGDQLWARRWSKGNWSTPIAITAPAKDLYRPAVAVDGRGRAWVVWSENASYGRRCVVPDFELWARAIEGEKAGTAVRLSRSPGSDVFPAAATDSSGRVWVTWQGWRNGRGAIFVATQTGDTFSRPMTIGTSKANEWNPAIAAAATGRRITVAWDTYRNGNYDVMTRTWTNGAWEAERPAAATARYEAHPSVAYAPDGRLWLAYEESSEGWGKDWGADESSGVSLYQGRVIRVRAFEPDGKPLNTMSAIDSALPGISNPHLDQAGSQEDATGWFQPDPGRWKQRPRSAATQHFRAPKNSYPRIAVDASGRVWLAFRSNHPEWWNPLGTVWSEYVTSYAGSVWTGSSFLAHSDAVLDNRPAMVTVKPGALMIVGSSDGRRDFEPIRRPGAGTVADDPYNFDLFVHSIELSPAAQRAQLEAAQPTVAGGPADATEQAQIAVIHGARIAGRYRIARGEFHRHSEISGDGANDGSLLDQWRYALDASHMDWIGCCDHDNGGGREYTWWTEQKLTDLFYAPGRFVPMFSYERSVPYPEGHRNVIFAQRGVRTLPRLPRTAEDPVIKAPDTQMLYRYLKQYNGIVASHTSGTNMGTDWRDNDPGSEPVVEIYQGERQNYEMPGAPRSNNAEDSIGGWRPKGFVSLALEMGYKLAFEASSDHISTHMSYANVLTTGYSRAEILEAFQKRHVYAATDNILAEFSSGSHIMGDEFSTDARPQFRVKLNGTAPFTKVHLIRDNQYIYAVSPGAPTVDFTWRDTSPVPGKASYYYVRGEQADGEVVWVSPMWITYTGQ